MPRERVRPKFRRSRVIKSISFFPGRRKFASGFSLGRSFGFAGGKTLFKLHQLDLQLQGKLFASLFFMCFTSFCSVSQTIQYDREINYCFLQFCDVLFVPLLCFDDDEDLLSQLKESFPHFTPPLI